jgi:glycosyltransferase involved in cell wall biosynthesis
VNRRRLSAVVTTFDNAATLDACLGSLDFADELLVLDSGSRDDTVAIATRHGARVLVEPFKGYGPQKQSAIDQAAHDWVLLLDADEALVRATRPVLLAALVADSDTTGWMLPRCERVFWRWQHRLSRHNTHLRLFDRRVHRMAGDPIHTAPQRDVGVVRLLDALILHQGEVDIASKVARMNHYSSGIAQARSASRSPLTLKLRLLFYPPVAFVKNWLFKGHGLNGWAGFIASVSIAYYAFLKDAKALERIEQARDDGSVVRRFAQQAQREEGDRERGQHQHTP